MNRACLLAKHEQPRPTSRHGIIERPVRRATKSARRTRAISMSATVDHGPDRLRNRRSQKSNFGVNGGRHRQGIPQEAASGTPMRKADESAARSFDKAISGLEVAHLLHRVPMPGTHFSVLFCLNHHSGGSLAVSGVGGLALWKELTCSIGR